MTAEWQPSNLYAPGDVVQPRLTDPILQGALTNPDFEIAGGWDETGNFEITAGNAFEGAQKLSFINGTLMTVGGADDNDGISVSTDGISWTEQDIDLLQHFGFAGINLEPAPALGKWFVDSITGIGGVVGAYESADNGVTWTNISPTGSFPSGPASKIKWISELGTMFYGVSTGVVYRSTDLSAWSASITSIPATAADFAFASSLGASGRLVYAVSTGTSIYTSDDGGINFTTRTLPWSGVAGVIWVNALSLFVAVQIGTGKRTATSTDGITWVDAGVVLPAGLNMLTQSLVLNTVTGRMVVVSNAAPYAAFSDDGTSWTAATTIDARFWQSVTYDGRNNQFVCAENSGTDSDVATTADGVTWITRTLTYPGLGGWQDIGFGTSPVVTTETSENTARLTVTPGQIITMGAYALVSGNYTATIGITWHGAADVLLSTDFSDSPIGGTSSAYRRISATATAPTGALTCSVVLGVVGTGDSVLFDFVTVSQSNPVVISQLLFRAVQTLSGYSDANEPVWPTVVGLQVVDNEVTWEAINANRVVWTAVPILKSGSSEPTFPAALGGEVADNTISWQATTRRVEDENCPNSKAVAIVASKVFGTDGDIIPFSATVNPLDWTTPNDAGFIPFGLNTYGSQDVTALGLYRSNLVAFNSKGFQMWQVDADPANFAILDAVPVGIPDNARASIQPVSNDLVFLTEAGIRNMGIAGASTNLQAGHFGKQIDKLVLAKIVAGDIPNALFFPGQGQYWIFFGAEAFVLTMNGGKQDMSWSRYTFPTVLNDWTILDKDLYLRSGDEVWRVSPDAALDRQTAPNVGTDFLGEVWWQYLDFGGLGDQKMMHGFDLVGTGACTITFGYDQSNAALVTAGWTVSDIDTLPGTMIPLPISGPSFQMRLSFSADQAWEWQAAAIYLDDQRTTA